MVTEAAFHELPGLDTAASGIRPEAVESIIGFAKKYDIDLVLLFGSRARGDFRRTRDIDLAVSGGDFTRFALDVDEETPTLLKYDFVNLDKEVQPGLLEEIYRDGKLLYEKV